jgi:hypothetical protein
MPRDRIVRRYFLRLIASAALGWAFAAHAAPADEIRHLVERGEADRAYAIGVLHPELRGHPEYDYYFGVAAIDSGRAGAGVVSLERYLARFPRNGDARMRLALGYLELGEQLRGRAELEHALRTDPSADERAVIRSYLDQMRLREPRGHSSAKLYLEAGTGTDRNMNAGVPNAVPGLPLPGVLPFTTGKLGERGDFAAYAAGGALSRSVGPGATLFGAVALDSRNYASRQASDFARAGAAGGASLARGSELYRLALAQSTLWVGGARLRSVGGVNGEWRHGLDELRRVQLSAQWAREDYYGAEASRAADYSALGFGYRELVIAPWRPVLTLGASVGDEHNSENRPDLGRTLFGLRARIELAPAQRWGLSAGLSLLESRYGAPDPKLGALRKDRYAQVDAAATYLLDRSWSMRGELTLADNHSSLGGYSYSRALGAVKLRYEFN